MSESKRNSFFEELANNNIFENSLPQTNEGVSKEAAEALTNNLSDDMLEAIAADLDDIYKEAAPTETVEDKVVEKKENDDTKGKTEEEINKEVANKEASDEDILASLEAKVAEKEYDEPLMSKEAQEAQAELEDIMEKEGQEVAEDIVKRAYDLAQEKFAEENITLADYVYFNIGDEHLASDIADKSEKLASIQNKNSFQVANDIILQVYNNCLTEEE